jgi:hypothetical protein
MIRKALAAGLKSTPKKSPWRVSSERLGRARVESIDYAAIAESVKLSVLDTEVDAHERRVVVLQPEHGADLAEPAGLALLEAHQPLICGESKDGQAWGPSACHKTRTGPRWPVMAREMG